MTTVHVDTTFPGISASQKEFSQVLRLHETFAIKCQIKAVSPTAICVLDHRLYLKHTFGGGSNFGLSLRWRYTVSQVIAQRNVSFQGMMKNTGYKNEIASVALPNLLLGFEGSPLPPTHNFLCTGCLAWYMLQYKNQFTLTTVKLRSVQVSN